VNETTTPTNAPSVSTSGTTTATIPTSYSNAGKFFARHVARGVQEVRLNPLL